MVGVGHDVDAARFGGGQVDLVQTHPEAGDHAQLGQGVDQCRVHAGDRRRGQGFEVGAAGGQEGRAVGLLGQHGHVVGLGQPGVEFGRELANMQEAFFHGVLQQCHRRIAD